MRSSLSFCRNLSVAGVLVLLFVSLASAYTLVMRGGKRIQIPDRFTLTPTVLTYQTSPGMNVTLQLAAIDIVETERANGEPAGSSFGECTPPRRSTRILKLSQWQMTRATSVTLRIESLSRTLGHDGK